MDPEPVKATENGKTLRHFPPYGSISGSSSGDTCPTCRGTGRIPRGQQDQLVAVIPCNDVRLKPRRTKLYVFISMVVCLFLCCLILFFLFPRSVTLTPVSVLSVMVYLTPNAVNMTVTAHVEFCKDKNLIESWRNMWRLSKKDNLHSLVENLINITNENFVPVQIEDFTMQGLVAHTVIGNTRITNMTAVESRSQKSYTINIYLSITDSGLNTYCKSSSIKIHTLFLQLQMTMDISYLSHVEQLSLDTFEYIDCGANSTTPHPVR